MATVYGDRVGLVAFAGSSFLQCPLTLDYSAFGVALDALDVHSIPRGGTAIGQAITTAREAFATGAGGEKILILITDGENHEGDPVAAAKEAREAGITIYTIGLGSPAGELIMVKDEQGNLSYLRDNEGRVVKTVLNERSSRDYEPVAVLPARPRRLLGLDTLTAMNWKLDGVTQHRRSGTPTVTSYRSSRFPLLAEAFWIRAMRGWGGYRTNPPALLIRKEQTKRVEMAKGGMPKELKKEGLRNKRMKTVRFGVSLDEEETQLSHYRILLVLAFLALLGVDLGKPRVARANRRLAQADDPEGWPRPADS